MLYLLFAFLAGALSLAAAQLLHARARRYRLAHLRSTEAKLLADLRMQGWREPEPSSDWLTDRWPVR